jgi:hypothetical protein
MEILLPSPDSQASLRKIIETVQGEYKQTKFTVGVKSKKLAPVDILIDLTIQVSALLLYDVIKRITRDMTDKGITPRLDASSRQILAESIVAKNGIRKFKLVRKSDTGDKSTYSFLDNRGNKHRVIVRVDATSDYQLEEKK